MLHRFGVLSSVTVQPNIWQTMEFKGVGYI